MIGRTVLATLASATLALSLAAGPGLAQSKSKSDTAAFKTWNSENVQGERPFGDFDMTMALSATGDQLRTWRDGLNDEQRAEMSGRCAVITDAGQIGKYPQDAYQFCKNYTGIE